MRPARPIAVLTVAVLAGCGPTSAGRSTGAQSAGIPCPTDADLAKTLGFTVTNANDPVRSGTDSVVCSYDGKRADGKVTSVQVHMVTGLDAGREYGGLKQTAADQHYTTSDRSGVGDEAFTFTNASYSLNYLVVLKDKKEVDISAQVPFEQEVALANLLIMP
jgi:hypothetical protein